MESELEMIIGNKLRALREGKNLSQGDIENRSGLLRCYISRVENGHTVPSLETLERLACAMEIPTYQLFYDGEIPPEAPTLPRAEGHEDAFWGSSGKSADMLNQFRRMLSRIGARDHKILLAMAQRMVRPNRSKVSKG